MIAERSLYGVVLAAGLSTRAGRFKMELPLGDRTLIEHTLLSMREFVHGVIVVGGHRVERLRELLRGYDQVEVITNERYPLGMFTSVQAGLRRASELMRADSAAFADGPEVGAGPAVFVIPGDITLVDPGTYRALLATPGGIVIPALGGRKGHPVLISAGLIEAVLAEPESSTLRDFVERVGYVTVEVGDEGIVLDVDDLDDYRRALEKVSARERGKDTQTWISATK